MGFGVRRAVINSTSTAALKFQPCVSTGAISGNSCKDCSFLIAVVALLGSGGCSLFLKSHRRDDLDLWEV